MGPVYLHYLSFSIFRDFFLHIFSQLLWSTCLNQCNRLRGKTRLWNVSSRTFTSAHSFTHNFIHEIQTDISLPIKLGSLHENLTVQYSIASSNGIGHHDSNSDCFRCHYFFLVPCSALHVDEFMQNTEKCDTMYCKLLIQQLVQT